MIAREADIIGSMSFAGMRVLSLESRRAVEMAQLIRNKQGDPIVAPSMREVPLDQNGEAFAFAGRLFSGEFDMMILLTGVGTRLLSQVLETRFPGGRFIDALRNLTVVARGPKPAAVLREWQVPIAAIAPEPNTWRELLAVTEGRAERRIAVQEYGRPSVELLHGLSARGAEVSCVRVYQWEMPEDTAPLREACARLAEGTVDVAVFTTSIQIAHLMRIAAEMRIEREVRGAFSRIVVASIGPTTSEALEEYGIHADLEPSHPKMGFLIQETAERVGQLLGGKR